MIISLATAARKKSSEQSEDIYEFPYKTKVSNTLNNMNKIVVMSGTATRESIKKNDPTSSIKTFMDEGKEENYQFEFIRKTSYHEEFIKLQIPDCKSRYKSFQTEEKIMTKSCEAIFDCLKSYTDKADLQTFESNQSVRGILKDVSFGKNTKRKVQFTKICEEDPIPMFLDSQESLPKYEFNKIMKNDKANFSLLSECPDLKNLTNINQTKLNSNLGGCQKAISSEDFIENVVSISEPLTFDCKQFSQQEPE